MNFSFQSCVLVLGLLLALQADAIVRVRMVSTYLDGRNEQTDESTLVIKSGAAGTCSGTTTTTCNSCLSLTGAPSGTGYVCNESGIHGSLYLYLSLSSSTGEDYNTTAPDSLIKMRVDGGTTIGTVTGTISSFNPTGGADQVVSFAFKWGDICGLAGAGTECKTSFSKTFTVGFDKDGDGTFTESAKVQISHRYVLESPLQSSKCDAATETPVYGAYSGFCKYTIYPGDEKVYVTTQADLSANLVAQDLDSSGDASSTSPQADASGLKVNRLRLYFAPNGGSFNVINAASSSYGTLTVNGTSINDNKLDGLTNGSSYIFLGANMDEAGNQFYFFDPTALDAQDPAVVTTLELGSTQAATPQEVFGLLEDQNCFIATAAYGSGSAEDVKTLRRFRNEYLLTWAGGRSFVDFYYQFSPPVADFIREHEWLKTPVRDALKPFVLMAWTLFKLGVVALFLLILISGAIFVTGVRLLQKRSTQ